MYMKNIKTILCGGLVAMLVSCSSQTTTTNYYFDSVNGDDANNGISVGTPFKSLAKLQSLTLKGGDSILLKSGAVFTEKLLLSCCGEENNPVVLEVAREMHCAVFTPSSIGVFGNNTPKDKTPQDTIRNPRTMYGVTKVSGELLSDYYNIRFGVDTRSVRFPGLISYVTPPGGGTTDYAVDIYYSAAKGEKFVCPIKQGTFMDMMYMPDGLRAAIEIMEANPDKLIHRNSFNIASMSFDPEIIYNNIKKYMPDFHMEYKVDPLRQAIAESWPNSLDDTCAREEWGWKPEYDLDSMTQDMLAKLKIRFNK